MMQTRDAKSESDVECKSLTSTMSTHEILVDLEIFINSVPYAKHKATTRFFKLGEEKAEELVLACVKEGLNEQEAYEILLKDIPKEKTPHELKKMKFRTNETQEIMLAGFLIDEPIFLSFSSMYRRTFTHRQNLSTPAYNQLISIMVDTLRKNAGFYRQFSNDKLYQRLKKFILVKKDPKFSKTSALFDLVGKHASSPFLDMEELFKFIFDVSNKIASSKKPAIYTLPTPKASAVAQDKSIYYIYKDYLGRPCRFVNGEIKYFEGRRSTESETNNLNSLVSYSIVCASSPKNSSTDETLTAETVSDDTRQSAPRQLESPKL